MGFSEISFHKTHTHTHGLSPEGASSCRVIMGDALNFFSWLSTAVAIGCYGKRYKRWRKPAMIGQLSFQLL